MVITKERRKWRIFRCEEWNHMRWGGGGIKTPIWYNARGHRMHMPILSPPFFHTAGINCFFLKFFGWWLFSISLRPPLFNWKPYLFYWILAHLSLTNPTRLCLLTQRWPSFFWLLDFNIFLNYYFPYIFIYIYKRQ